MSNLSTDKTETTMTLSWNF